MQSTLFQFWAGNVYTQIIKESDARIPYQCTKQVNRFQDQFLVANACDSQLLQLLVSDVQQLLAIDLLSFKIFYVLLETIIEAYWEETNNKQNNAHSEWRQS